MCTGRTWITNLFTETPPGKRVNLYSVKLLISYVQVREICGGTGTRLRFAQFVLLSYNLLKWSCYWVKTKF